jgi:hypothetical protein
MFLVLRLRELELINSYFARIHIFMYMPEIQVGRKLHHGAFLRGHFSAESAGEMNSGPINPPQILKARRQGR